MDEELQNSELSNEEIQQNQEAMRDQKSNATNTKIVTAGAKAAANYFAPGVGGEAVELASKTKMGGALLNAGGQALTQATKNAPMGNQLQDTLNKADDAGVVDMASNALDMKSGGAKAAAGGTAAGGAASNASSLGGTGSNLSPLSSSSSSLLPNDSSGSSLSPLDSMSPDSSSPIGDFNPLSMMNPSKSWSMYLIGAAVVLLVIIVALYPNTTLTLTSGTGGTTARAATISNLLTTEQVENLLIYVGDSRIDGTKLSLNKNNINYISKTGVGYNWYIETAKNELSALISADTQKFVVFNLGLNDLSNIDLYINVYNTLISNYKNVKLYFMSVNPVNEELALQNNYSVTNTQIEAFNSKLSSAFSTNYIDVYTKIKDKIQTQDGIHYSEVTYKEIHDIVIKYVKDNNIFSFLGEYPSVEKSKVLEALAITSALGDDGINALNNFINSQINLGGKCTEAGVAGAATGLIYGLHTQGYHLPYYYGGGHGTNNGIDLKWGTDIGNSIPTPKGNVYRYSGLDCSGFVAWAMNTAGVIGGSTASNYRNYGPTITYEQASAGDLLVNDGHVIMVIENKGTYLQCAESTSGGVQFSKQTKKDVTSNNYVVIDMKNYYENNCA